MWVIKSIGLGLLAVIAALFTFVVGMIIVLMTISSRMPDNQGVGWDPVSFTRQWPVIWVVIFLIFLAGFAVGYRRFSPRFPQ